MQILSIQNKLTDQHNSSIQNNQTSQLTNIDIDDKPISYTQAETQHDQYINNIHSNYQHDVITEFHQEKKQNRTQTTSDNMTRHEIQKCKNINNKPTREEYLQSIRLSYMVLGSKDIMDMNSKSPQKKKQTKKSFVIIEEQSHYNNNNNCQSPRPIISKQSLKQPLLIDLKKIQTSAALMNNKKALTFYNQLSQQLYMYSNTNKRWQRCHIDIDQQNKKQLVISSIHIPLLTIEKIKIFKPNKVQKMREIKLTYSASTQSANIFLNAKQEKLIKKLPINYLLFQEIISQKLTNQNTNKQTKWSKHPHICQQIIFESYIFGQIYKKSQYFGKWQKRYIVLNSQGVFSYKSGVKKQDCSFFIERKSIEYLWTRFDMIDNFLIIKLKHGMKQTQFGIPVTNYSSAHFKNWLYYFYKLMEVESG